jgi:hypothetical protein
MLVHLGAKNNNNKKFWEELIAYFPMIRYGPHRKRRLQQFVVAAGTSLPSCYLATIGGYTNRPTDWPLMRCGLRRKWYVQQFSIITCIRFRGNVFTDPKPNNEWRDTYYRAFTWQRLEGYIYKTHRLMGEIYELLRRCAQVPWCIHTKFHKVQFSIQKFRGR